MLTFENSKCDKIIKIMKVYILSNDKCKMGKIMKI